jgi:hypothetical protein
MPNLVMFIMSVTMYVLATTSTASGQTQDLPNAMTWLAPAGTSVSNQVLDSAGNGAFSGYRRYSMPSSYMPDGMYLPPPRIVWDDTLGYWDNSQIIDAGGYCTDDANSGMWYSEEAYYGAHPDAISPTGEILQSALYYPNWVINPVWLSTPGYRTIPDDVPRQYYATETVNVYVALGDSMVAVQRTLTVLEKMTSGDDAQVSSTTSLEEAYLDWSTGLFSTGEFYPSFPQQQTEPGEGGDSTGQAAPTANVVEVDIGYTRVILNAYHTFTLFTDTSVCGGLQYEVRAGPSDVFGPTLTDGGDLFARAEAYDENAKDRPSETIGLQKIGTLDTTISEAYNYSLNFAFAVNYLNLDYSPLNWNSGYNRNSFTSTFLEYLGFTTVIPALWAPGFDPILPPLNITPSPFNVTAN